MPELPEVETIKLSLKPHIIGQKITQLKVLNPKSFNGSSSSILNKNITNLFRRAKMLVIELQDQNVLVIHLKMSGQIIYQSKSFSDQNFVGGHPTQDMLQDQPNKHTRVIFEFSSGDKLFFNDQRKFGWIKLLKTKDLEQFFKSLGPEPLEKEFTLDLFTHNLLKHPNWPIKLAIMEPKVVVGVGNIYANEALFNSQINPQTKVKSLSSQDISNLYQGIIKALSDGIKYGGSTKTHFTDSQGRKGVFLDHARVYGKDKTNCLNCHTEIIKIKLGGRGTFFCPTCQVLV